MTSEALRGSSLHELERVYREASLDPLPRGTFCGKVLHRLDSPFARSKSGSAATWPFERLTFGVDFRAAAWFFLHPGLRLAYFRATPGPSRWRDTQTLQLHYDLSRLPFRGQLYDEVKPLSGTLCLGLGGLNRQPESEGDLFFFLLEARGVTPRGREPRGCVFPAHQPPAAHH